MPTPRAPALDVGRLLDRVTGTAPVDAVEAAAEVLAEMLGARELTFLIADSSGRAVVRLTTGGPDVAAGRNQAGAWAETVPMADTVYERVLRTQEVDVQALGEGARVIAPVTDRGDAIGLLELVLPGQPTPAAVDDVGAAAHALAHVVIAARRYTDAFEGGQRTTQFSLAAEIQRRLLPAAYTWEAGQFTLAGWLEPAASLGGDTFDHTVNDDALHVSITDAVGHPGRVPHRRHGGAQRRRPRRGERPPRHGGPAPPRGRAGVRRRGAARHRWRPARGSPRRSDSANGADVALASPARTPRPERA